MQDVCHTGFTDRQLFSSSMAFQFLVSSHFDGFTWTQLSLTNFSTKSGLVISSSVGTTSTRSGSFVSSSYGVLSTVSPTGTTVTMSPALRKSSTSFLVSSDIGLSASTTKMTDLDTLNFSPSGNISSLYFLRASSRVGSGPRFSTENRSSGLNSDTLGFRRRGLRLVQNCFLVDLSPLEGLMLQQQSRQ